MVRGHGAYNRYHFDGLSENLSKRNGTVEMANTLYLLEKNSLMLPMLFFY